MHRHHPAILLAPALSAGLLSLARPAAAEILNASLVGTWDGFCCTYADVWAEGDVAVLGHFGAGSIDLVDLAVPWAPALLAAYELAPPNDTASAQDVKLHGGLLYIGLEGGEASAQIVNVRDPSNPVPLVDVVIDGFLGIHNVFVDGDHLYLVDSNTPQVGIVDLSGLDPDDPPAEPITEVQWMVENVGTSKVHDITVVNGRMYASAWDSGLFIYDVSGVATSPPVLLGSAPGDNTHSCWPTDAGDFVITGEERTGGGITVFRVTENGDGTVGLEQTDHVALPTSEASSVHNQATIGYRVYNSWYGAGLRVYDVNPASGRLRIAAVYDPPDVGAAWGVYPFLGSDRVLVSDMSDGLLVIDVDAPRPGDVDGDGVVGFGDLLALLAAWGPCPDPPAGCPADLDGNDTVNFADLLTLLANWG